MLYGVIIAGGAGKRLWPKSRKGLPKYLLKGHGKKSLLKQTVDRIRQLTPLDNILVFTGKGHAGIVSREIRGLTGRNIIAEPVSRNTAPCVCLAAFLIRKRDPDGIILIMPADHIIEDKDRIKEILSLAVLIARMKKCLLTIGIKPAYPATGYGYIKTARLYKRLLTDRKLECYKVDRFMEKPPLNRARTFLKSKNYLWNSGIFIGKAQTFLEEFKRYSPRIYRIAEKIERGLGARGRQCLMNRHYKDFPDTSIDYAVIEKTRIAYVVKADVSWLDIGSWQSLEGYLKKDLRGNIVIGDCLGAGLSNSIIVGEKGRLIATLGVDNMVVVQAGNSTLVCAKDRAEDVKKLVELAEEKGLERYL